MADAQNEINDGGLVRVLGRWDLTAVGVNQVIGSGIFVMPAAVAAAIASSVAQAEEAPRPRATYSLSFGHSALGLLLGAAIGAVLGIVTGAAIACRGSSCDSGILFGALGGSAIIAPAGGLT